MPYMKPPMGKPPLSARSIELLLDLVAIKLGAMEVEDRDARTIGSLKRCRDELGLIGPAARAAEPKRRPGRPARVEENPRPI